MVVVGWPYLYMGREGVGVGQDVFSSLFCDSFRIRERDNKLYL